MSLLLAFLLGLLRREKGVTLIGEKGIVHNLGICREMSDVKWKGKKNKFGPLNYSSASPP